jgi:hypothetical protein
VFRPLGLLVVASSLGVLPGGGCACEAEPVVARTVTLVAFPERIDVGAVPLFARADVEIIVANQGNAPWEPTAAPSVVGNGWSWVDGCDAPLPPNAFCTARVRFAPVGAGPAPGSFTVLAPGDGGLDVATTVPLAATDAPAQVRLSPDVLDFGAVVVGRSETRVATVLNLGPEAVTVPLVTEAPFLIDGVPGPREVVVPPAGAVDVAVVFAPEQTGPSDDVLRAPLCGAGCGPAVALRGQSTTPRIDVAPRVLDLGSAVPGTAMSAELVVTNTGDGALAVADIDVDGNPEVAIAVPALPLLLAPGTSASLPVTWTPSQGAVDVDAVVTFASDDPLAPLVFVPVTGTASGAGVEVTPAALHLGFLAPGAARTAAIVVRSTGDAPVHVREVRVEGGGGAFTITDVPPAGPLAPREAFRFFVRGEANAFAVDGGGATARVVVLTDELAPRAVDVAFGAGSAGCVPRALVGHVALGAVRLGEQAGGDAVIENLGDAPCTLADVRDGDDVGLAFDREFTFSFTGLATLLPGATGAVRFGYVPVSQSSASATVMFAFDDVAAPVLVSASGRGVRGGLVATPPVVELGPVPAACAGPIADVLLVNDGAARLTVAEITTRDDVGAGTAAFALALPAVPFDLLPGASAHVGVRGVAGVGPGRHAATLRASSDVGEAAVRLALIVTEGATPVEERFVAADIDAVDILLVVDNSGSMADDQQLLAANFASFFGSALADDGIDFQVGVTTTDVLSPAGARGRLVGEVLTRGTANLAEAFAAQVQVGIDGAGLELGLEAVRLALADPVNAPLFRDEAALSVVFVTDEEDAGALVDLLPDPALSRAPDEYVALLLAKKGGARANAPVLVSAVLNPAGAARYEALVERFAGTRLDITTPDWGGRLGEIGVDTFALSRTFTLASSAEDGSITVTIDGRATTAFTYDDARRAVTLDEAPRPGAEIVIRYLPGCE